MVGNQSLSHLHGLDILDLAPFIPMMICHTIDNAVQPGTRTHHVHRENPQTAQGIVPPIILSDGPLTNVICQAIKHSFAARHQHENICDCQKVPRGVVKADSIYGEIRQIH